MSSGYSDHSSHNRAQTNDHMWILIPFLWQHVCTVYSGHMCVLFTLVTCVYCLLWPHLCTVYSGHMCVLCTWPHACTLHKTICKYCLPDHIYVLMYCIPQEYLLTVLQVQQLKAARAVCGLYSRFWWKRKLLSRVGGCLWDSWDFSTQYYRYTRPSSQANQLPCTMHSLQSILT